jgi:hypothetical protein
MMFSAPDSAELLSIYNKLVEIAKTQKIFQRRIEKRKWKNLVCHFDRLVGKPNEAKYRPNTA